MAGIVTETGGGTSHAAILARSRGVPAVTGLKGIPRLVKTGDTVVVDGRDGHVIINPDPETLSALFETAARVLRPQGHIGREWRPAGGHADGEKIQLLANINSLADAQAAVAMGASGVALFRTEYLFLTHPDVPDEEQQLQAYREIIAASPNHQVTIRTLDLGGDKTIPYLGHAARPIRSSAGDRFACRSSIPSSSPSRSSPYCERPRRKKASRSGRADVTFHDYHARRD